MIKANACSQEYHTIFMIVESIAINPTITGQPLAVEVQHCIK